MNYYNRNDFTVYLASANNAIIQCVDLNVWRFYNWKIN